MTDESLKIVHVTSAGSYTYGAVMSMMTLAKAQIAAGEDVQFETWKGRKFGAELRGQGYRAHEVKVRTKIDVLAILQMRRWFREQRFDIVHTHLSTSSINGCLAARFAKIPSVATVHGMSSKWSFIFADHMIGVSQGVCDHIVSQGVPRSRTTPVYNGVDVPAGVMTKQEARKAFNLPPEAAVFGTVARLTRMKGIDTGLEAFRILAEKVPGSHYILVGNGDGETGYRQWVDNHNLQDRVHFLGYQSNVFNPLAAMDLFLFPSLKEAMGISVVEALAMGLPVVSSNVGGLPEVITPKVGVLVPASDPNAMAKEALAALQNPNLPAEAKLRAEAHFSVDSMREGTRRVYQMLIEA
ncbi:MAG: glycosyltransferase family 4 protein [Armatimonadota bacterium]